MMGPEEQNVPICFTALPASARGLGQQLQSVLARFEDTETVRGWLCTRGQGQHGGERLPQKKTAAENRGWRHDVLYMRFDRFEPAIGQKRFT
jgi:hypothetical protein